MYGSRRSFVMPDGLANMPELGRSRVVMADVVDPYTPLRHDPEKLAGVLLRVLNEKSIGIDETVRPSAAVI